MKIKSIKSKGTKRVINLTVHKNHTFIHKDGFVVSNCDGLTPDAQKAARGTIEDHIKHTSFIMTANYKEKLIEPLRNRFIEIDFDYIFKSNKKEIGIQMYNRLTYILDNENIKYNKQDVQTIITTFYPSIRGMISILQKTCTSGELIIDDNILNQTSQYIKLMQFAKDKNFSKVRELLLDMSDPGSVFTYLFKNLDTYIKPESQPNVILIVAKYQDMYHTARDKMIPVAAMFVEIIANPKVDLV